MRREDLLQVLLIRFVDPQREDQDWVLIAGLFYSLTKLLLPARRVEQLYYQYLQSHGGRAAMEAACKEHERQLTAKLQQSTANSQGSAVSVSMGIRRASAGSVSALRGAGVLSANAPGLPSSSLTSIGVMGASGSGSDGIGSCGSLANLSTLTSFEGMTVNDDGHFIGGGEAALRQLTPEQRGRWRRLRQELISPDVLIVLVQRFTLVEGAAVFLAPVHPSTVMEFNGVRSGPYSTVVMHPLSLMGIKRRVLDARRDYELHKRQAQPSLSMSGSEAGVTTRRRGRAATATTAAAVVESGETTNMSSGVSDDGEAIRTLQDLERAVWHITANCVVFNAPESYYPFTARQFAAACTNIIDEYCLERILGM